MSCFIVPDSVIDAVVRAANGFHNDGHLPTLCGVALGSGAEALDRLGRKLLAMNEAAYGTRYSGRDIIGSDSGHYVYKGSYEGIQRTPVEMLARCFKALDCLIYQCSEGDVYESADFAELEAFKNKFAAFIVSRLPAYDAAPWGR